MSLRSIPLFDRSGRPTVFMIRQWAQRSPQQYIRQLSYLEADRTATPGFRQLWSLAFPLRGPLPPEPLADAEGRATDAFWRVFA
jgi:hypothetical protein